MKYAGVFCALLASIAAWPHNEVENLENDLSNAELISGVQRNGLVGDLVAQWIEQLSKDIVAAGLDPWDYDHYDTRVALPVPSLFNAHAYVGDLHFSGISNIVINRINFSILSSKLTFDISLPAITASVRDASLAATIFSELLEVRGNGKVVVVEPRVQGEARVSIGIISGISVRNLKINFSLGGIESDVYSNILGNNYSDLINDLLRNTIPSLLASHENEINELIEFYGNKIIEQLLN